MRQAPAATTTARSPTTRTAPVATTRWSRRHAQGARSYLRSGSTYQALQLAELGLSEAPDDFVLLGTAARAAWLAGLSEDAVAHAERLLTVARHRGLRETESSRTAPTRAPPMGARRSGRDGACTESLIELVDVLPRGEELGHAMACIAQSAMLRDIPDLAIEWADRAIALADELDLPSVRVWAQCEKGSSLLMIPERIEEGIDLLDAVADDAEAAGEYVIVARALEQPRSHRSVPPGP